MDTDTDSRPDATPPAEHPADWDRREMKSDFGDGTDAAPAADGPDAPDWNERQMARGRRDGTRTSGPSDAEIASSEGGLSGGGTNPGGGERWAERDTETTGG